MKTSDSLFPETSESLFDKLGIPGFHKELTDKPGTFYFYIKDRVGAEASIKEMMLEDFGEKSTVSRDNYEKFKRYESRMKRPSFWKDFDILRGRAVLANESPERLSHLNDVRRYISQLKNKQKFQSTLSNFAHRGNIHISPTTSIKGSIGIKDIIDKAVERFPVAERSYKFQNLMERYKDFPKFHDEFMKLLYFLKDIYNERNIIQKKGIDIFDLTVSGKKKFLIENKRTGLVQEIEDVENNMEYILFVFSHNDAERRETYKNLIKTMHAKDNSWARRQVGENIALRNLRDISVACSDIRELVETILDTGSDQPMSHMKFDSSMKFFFITQSGLKQNVDLYLEQIMGYYGEKLGRYILQNVLKDRFIQEVDGAISPSESPELIPELSETQKPLLEFESDDPILGERIVMLSVPKFMISENVDFKEIKNLVGNYIAKVSDEDIIAKSRSMDAFLSEKYIKAINEGYRKRGVLRELMACFNMLFFYFLNMKGGETKILLQAVEEAMRGQQLDKKLKSGSRPGRVAKNNEGRPDPYAMQKSEYEIVKALMAKNLQTLLHDLNALRPRFDGIQSGDIRKIFDRREKID